MSYNERAAFKAEVAQVESWFKVCYLEAPLLCLCLTCIAEPTLQEGEASLHC